MGNLVQEARMDGSRQRLTRKQRRDLRTLERELEHDPWLEQAFAELPRTPLLQRVSPFSYMSVGVLTILCGMFTEEGLCFLVGLSCIAVGIIGYRHRDRPQPLVVKESPPRETDPREREF